jgi:hypothetical protein
LVTIPDFRRETEKAAKIQDAFEQALNLIKSNAAGGSVIDH